MDERSIVLYLHRKGLSAHVIHDDLVATLDLQAVASNTLTPCLREANLGTAEVTLDRESSSLHIHDSDQAILIALEEDPFPSVQQLVRATHIPGATVYRRLTKSLGIVRRHLCCVPHLLSDPHKVRYVELSLSFLRILEVQEQKAWHDVVTLDESWFYCSTDHESIWLRLCQKVR
jgi:hypothetical protein